MKTLEMSLNNEQYDSGQQSPHKPWSNHSASVDDFGFLTAPSGTFCELKQNY